MLEATPILRMLFTVTLAGKALIIANQERELKLEQPHTRVTASRVLQIKLSYYTVE